MLWLAADDANGSLAHSARVRIVILPASIDLSIYQGWCERGKEGRKREGRGGENSAMHRSIIWVFHSLSPPRERKQRMLIAHPRKGAEGRKIENVWRPPGYPVASASVRSADAKTREEITEMAVAADTNCGESKGGEGGNILARGGGNMHFSPPAPPWAFGQRIRSAGVWPRAASGPTLSQRRRPRRDWTPTTARTTASYGVMYWLPCSRGVRHTRPSFLLRVHDG